MIRQGLKGYQSPFAAGVPPFRKLGKNVSRWIPRG
jgi:hypothetical protein